MATPGRRLVLVWAILTGAATCAAASAPAVLGRAEAERRAGGK